MAVPNVEYAEVSENIALTEARHLRPGSTEDRAYVAERTWSTLSNADEIPLWLRNTADRPRIKTIILTDRYGDLTAPTDLLSNPSLATLLGPNWILVHEESYRWYYEWRFYIFHTLAQSASGKGPSGINRSPYIGNKGSLNVWQMVQVSRGDESKKPADRAGAPKSKAPAAQVKLRSEADNRWGVPVWDVRGVTLGMLALSKDPACARNAISYGGEDGTSFSGQTLEGAPEVEAGLEYRRDRLLAEGSPFIPKWMEEKWALFFCKGWILCVRSWQRKVVAAGETWQEGERIVVRKIRGSLAADEDPLLTVRAFDFLIRSHVLSELYPAPVPQSLEAQPEKLGLWCFSMFGNRALPATAKSSRREIPWIGLAVELAVAHRGRARGNYWRCSPQLDLGVPMELLAVDGLTALHWSLVAKESLRVMEFLLAQGCPVDARSAEGATALMNAVQTGTIEQAQFLIERGADVNAADHRGAQALHRAAELGKKEMVELLLRYGARDAEVLGYTALSFAEKRGHVEIVKMLRAGI